MFSDWTEKICFSFLKMKKVKTIKNLKNNNFLAHLDEGLLQMLPVLHRL